MNKAQPLNMKGKLEPFDKNIKIDEIVKSVTERIIKFMPDVSSVEVKKQCKINGNGDGTSNACNQGEIKNISLKKIK